MQDTPARACEPVQIAAFVDPAVKRQLVAQAEQNCRSVSGEIRLALRRHPQPPPEQRKP